MGFSDVTKGNIMSYNFAVLDKAIEVIDYYVKHGACAQKYIEAWGFVKKAALQTLKNSGTEAGQEAEQLQQPHGKICSLFEYDKMCRLFNNKPFQCGERGCKLSPVR